MVVNPAKCELIVLDDDQDYVSACLSKFREVAPGICQTQKEKAVLLGAPLTPSCVDSALRDKLCDLKRMASRLEKLDSHDAIFLLKNCYAIPQLLYLLRCSACFKSAVLPEYDKVLREALESILNVRLTDESWRQASLPVALGGIGVRCASTLALPAFLSSCHGSLSLVQSAYTQADITDQIDNLSLEALLSWYDMQVPSAVIGGVPNQPEKQSSWDMSMTRLPKRVCWRCLPHTPAIGSTQYLSIPWG